MAVIPMFSEFSSSFSPDCPLLKHGSYLQGREAAKRTLADKVLI
ncbi:hypothetical protein VIS19158_11573 [Vibrio scophthalmi LMG 19158]|uniref:Uncharacterized protein n=1 Tax=Vibrio scophthalmi LMG 19158 TaxID=870967 RepID=F9RIA2_9VIBR|nr:hypothetical protein VIS19158_11573 [Vibrio scophthalmi LMG 19158]